MNDPRELWEWMRGSLIVSCQAREHSPLRGPTFMSAMARAAALGGARAVRANGPTDILAIKREVEIPVIGINKIDRETQNVYITPTFESALEVAKAGADVIATDATGRIRPDGGSLTGLIGQIREELRVPVMADVDSFDSGVSAYEAGAELIATTLSGYTEGGEPPTTPDLDLVTALVRELPVPVIAEGRYSTPEHVRQAFDFGAHAVVVGTAITNPVNLTKMFAEACPINQDES